MVTRVDHGQTLAGQFDQAQHGLADKAVGC